MATTKHTLASITALYKETFFTTDDESIALVAAIMISSKLSTPPVWLYLIGPSSGGKSALIDAFGQVDFNTQVSDLTPNTFLSGMANRNGKESSLLRRLGLNFVITMKDFTTIMSKNDQDQQAIIAQMREIYDGYITKETGTGETLVWGGKGGLDPKGKATFIMASTEAIYKIQEKFSDMGTRAINYVLKPIDRKMATKQAIRNNNVLEEKVDHIQKVFKEYVSQMIDSLPGGALPKLDDDVEDQIIEVADFVTVARSAVHRDYKGAKSLVPSAEMPMRMSRQLLTTGQVFTHMCDGVLPENLKQCVFKIGFDSIPKQRRETLVALARYPRVTKSGVADHLNFPPDRAQEWIDDLNSFGFCTRIKSGSKQFWELKPEYRKIMLEYFNLTVEDNILDTDDLDSMGGGNYEDVSYEASETQVIMNEDAQKAFDAI